MKRSAWKAVETVCFGVVGTAVLVIFAALLVTRCEDVARCEKRGGVAAASASNRWGVVCVPRLP